MKLHLTNIVILFCIFYSAFIFIGCNTNTHEAQKPVMRDINKVMEDHTAELMALPGVVGVAISELDDHTPCIMVMVVRQTPELTAKIPKTLEGHPVMIHESGEIKPMR